MPRNVATPEQAQRAKAGVQELLDGNSYAGQRPLSKADRRILTMGLPDIYIYNVSPIFPWSPRAAGMGVVSIPVRDKDAKVSEPVKIPGAIIRSYDAGNRKRQSYSEEGLELVKDLLGCSEEMPGLPQNNITRFGVFYIVGKKFEDLSDAEQQQLLDENNAKHNAQCADKVLEADGYAGNDVTARWITNMYRMCAKHLGLKRDWLGQYGHTENKVEECPFCGSEFKRGKPICPNCKNVVNQAALDQVKAAQEPKGKRAAS